MSSIRTFNQVSYCIAIQELKYDIIKQISSGSFGTIYEVMVEHEEGGVTISTTKCVLKELTRIDPLSKERFERD